MMLVKVGVDGDWLDPGRVEAVYKTHVRVRHDTADGGYDFHNEPRVGVRMASGEVFMVAKDHDTDAIVRTLWPEEGPYR